MRFDLSDEEWAIRLIPNQVDAVVMPEVPQQRGSAPASCVGLQSGQLHADAGLAEGGGTLVADYAAGEAGQDRSQGGPARSVRHVPACRGGDSTAAVRRNPAPHRSAQAESFTIRPETRFNLPRGAIFRYHRAQFEEASGKCLFNRHRVKSLSRSRPDPVGT